MCMIRTYNRTAFCMYGKADGQSPGLCGQTSGCCPVIIGEGGKEYGDSSACCHHSGWERPMGKE